MKLTLDNDWRYGYLIHSLKFQACRETRLILTKLIGLAFAVKRVEFNNFFSEVCVCL